MSHASYTCIIEFGQQDFVVDTNESLSQVKENAAAVSLSINYLDELLGNVKSWVWSEAKLPRG